MTIRQIQDNGEKVEVCLCPLGWRGHPIPHRFFSKGKVPACLICIETGEVPLACLFKCGSPKDCTESRAIVKAHERRTK